MKSMIVSRLLPDTMRNKLFAHGYDCINAGINNVIDNETKYHPDMQFFKLSNDAILYANRLDGIDEISNCDLKIIKTEAPMGEAYPFDCLLNCFYAKESLICGRYVAEEIIDECNRTCRDVVRVKQGYSACSTVRLSNSAFITSDITIYKALAAIGCDVLKVVNDGIGLNGFGNGFIGGCAFSDTDSEFLFFTGDISKHINYTEVSSFCREHKKIPISLSDAALYDYGGAIVL